MFLSATKKVLVCPKVWYTFEKVVKIKFDDLGGGIRKYRLRYNSIIFIYSEGPLQHNIEFSENFTFEKSFFLGSTVSRAKSA